MLAGEPTRQQGKTMFVETGVDLPDRMPTWYAPMVAQPHAPVFEILATRGTRGRYYNYTYAATLKDLVKWHGHDCEGLTHAACCCKVALNLLFLDGVVDRSVLRGISGSSPCWSDAVAFLTGARIQYGNLGFFKDKKVGHAVLLVREDTGAAVLATWREGINTIPDEPVVLPGRIDWKTQVDTEEIVKLKIAVKREERKPTPYDVDKLRYLQWKHVNDVLTHPLTESYQARLVTGFEWKNWVDPTKQIANPHHRSDIRLKNFPYRTRPVDGPEE